MTGLPRDLICPKPLHASSFEEPAIRHKSEEFKKFMLFSEDEEKEELPQPQPETLLAAIPVIPSCPSAELSPKSIVPRVGASLLAQEMENLFEQMTATMIILSFSHETETTFFLDSPKFATSALFGTRITIKEFSTAPKAFNIEIASNPQALQIFEVQKSALLAAFAQEHFTFSVNRLDTQLHSTSYTLDQSEMSEDESQDFEEDQSK